MHNQDGKITHFMDLQVRTGTDTKLLRFLLTNLGKDEVILGYPWLTAFEPTIHWKDATLDKNFQPIIISSLNPKGGWEVSLELESAKVTLRKTTVAFKLAQLAADKTKK